MSTWLQKLKGFIPFSSGRTLAGRDLEGNKYYEYPIKGARPKRIVKYRSMYHLSDYTSGKLSLPVQWRAWLTFTRTTPPSMSELQTDQARIQALSPRIIAIEERERLERIRQGYLVESPEQTIPRARISEPSFTPAPSIPAPSSSSSSTYPVGSSEQHRSRLSATANSRNGTGSNVEPGSYQVPTPTSSGVVSPPNTVNPSRNSSPEDLRRLAEEDTKRRIKESGVRAGVGQASSEKAEGVGSVGLGAGLKPRKRGGA